MEAMMEYRYYLMRYDDFAIFQNDGARPVRHLGLLKNQYFNSQQGQYASHTKFRPDRSNR